MINTLSELGIFNLKRDSVISTMLRRFGKIKEEVSPFLTDTQLQELKAGKKRLHEITGNEAHSFDHIYAEVNKALYGNK